MKQRPGPVSETASESRSGSSGSVSQTSQPSRPRKVRNKNTAKNLVDAPAARADLPFSLYVAADLHMERDKQTNFSRYLETIPPAEVLVLAGDVGNPLHKKFSQFLQCCSDRHSLVIFVPGNHEHWYMDLEKLNALCNSVGVVMLYNGCLTYKGVTFAGTTFWTALKTASQKDVDDQLLLRKVNDFRYVAGMTRQVWLEAHTKALSFVRRALRKYPRVVVVTHHSPTFQSIQKKYKHAELTGCYASHCDDLFDAPSLVAWVHGHTHFSCRLQHRTGKAILINNSGRLDVASGTKASHDQTFHNHYKHNTNLDGLLTGSKQFVS
jgi:predicted phosphohydrolase